MIHTLQRNDEIPTNLFDSVPPTQKNALIQGDCIDVMRQMPAATVDLIVTDPPYLVNYRSRDGRTLSNDDNDRWLAPAFAEAFRVLRPNRVCVSFYGWSRVDRFFAAWRAAGFWPVGHLVFVKPYTSAMRFVCYQHEQAYILAKGHPTVPVEPVPDVLTWQYSGNRLHPTEKPLSALTPLIRAFSREGDIVLDPFCGSGSTLVAARGLKRNYIGIELDAKYHAIAANRLRREIAA